MMIHEPIAVDQGLNRRVHKFEIAGLGPAPYVFLRVEKRAYQACQGAPVQPGTTCDYCGTSIMFAFILRAADGSEFKVGCDCVHKTNDTRLIGAIADAERRHRREVTEARENAQIAEFEPHLDAFLSRFASEPHPNSYYASQGKTRADYKRFCWMNSGRAGRAKLARTWLKALRSAP